MQGSPSRYRHSGMSVAVNTFLWIRDIAIGEGVNYASWITIPRGIGLAINAGASWSSRYNTNSLPARVTRRSDHRSVLATPPGRWQRPRTERSPDGDVGARTCRSNG